jgi:iron complex transport system ATP-binding protein
VITIEDVTIERGNEGVLKGVSAAVDAGECVGLVGPNGVGKTTLLQCLNGALTPDRGSVRVAGDDVASLSAAERGRRVATVPQHPTIPFEYDVETVVAMGRTPHLGRFDRVDADDREAVQAALERTDTAAFAERSITTLSGGERQRVLIARALAQEPGALLLDEPTTSLDVDHQQRCLAVLRDVVDDGHAVLTAIHDLDLAARFCDRLLLLADGDVVARGAPADVLTSATVERVFGVEAAVEPHPVTGTPTVVTTAGEGRETPASIGH